MSTECEDSAKSDDKYSDTNTGAATGDAGSSDGGGGSGVKLSARSSRNAGGGGGRRDASTLPEDDSHKISLSGGGGGKYSPVSCGWGAQKSNGNIPTRFVLRFLP